jgi:sulfatase maturation enzyme AslB (radical SAM superfamily)
MTNLNKNIKIEDKNDIINEKINNEVSIIYDVNNKNLDKSENIYNDLDTIIEKNIEKKINNLLETLPNNIDKDKIKEQKNFYDLSLRELYKNTLQTIIDILNDITNAYSNGYVDNSNYIYIIINILSKEERRLYVGIILLFLSFIIYFIDGVSI